MTDTAIIIVGALSSITVFITCMSCVYYFGLYDVSLFSRHEGLHRQENPQRAEI